MPAQTLNQSLKPLAWASIAGIGLGFGTVALFAASLSTFQEWLGAAAGGSLIAAAFLVVGGVLGFLFGLPRTLHHDAASGEKSSSGAPLVHHINTNLEQISDWLTKILVGLGLANLNRIHGQLNSLSHNLAAALSDRPSPASVQFVFAVVIFFLALGFLVGYLWTRLDLAQRIRHADLI